ncbi:MAG: ThiF family adenylyltransferase [Cytophagaceae bacterium]
MNTRLSNIVDLISTIENVEIVKSFEQNGLIIEGSIYVLTGSTKLLFEVLITSTYPFQFHNVETIRFINKELISYNHVNVDGSICIHTLHSPDLKTKLKYDFDSLKQWIVKYYIQCEVDHHYEHIIAPFSSPIDKQFCFLFTEVDHQFKKGDFGFMKCSFLANGFTGQANETYIIQSFKVGREYIPCKWSVPYKSLADADAIYVFLKNPPVTNRRFIVESWNDLEPYIDQHFLKFLYDHKRTALKTCVVKILPLFIGYDISDNEIHWQCAAIDLNDYPNYSEKVPGKNEYIGHLNDEKINWLQTKNCSYKYFFGRGVLNKRLTDQKILVIGLGAIGSILSTTLIRGGCKEISLIDYDIKEPENVCRSEYNFKTGVTSKVIDLGKKLIDISPFIEITAFEGFTDTIKYFINTGKFNKDIKSELENYDVIFDCSTDNDLAYILDSLELNSSVINLSVTNYAEDLVCAVNPNLYKMMNHMYSILNKPAEDLYNPTGCWSPTFKASYNDVALMVQYAIKQINNSYNKDLPLRNFYLQTDENGTNIKLHQY